MAQSPYLGVNPENPDSLTDGPDHPPQYGEEVAQGELLEEEDEVKVAARLRKLWTDQDLLHSRYLADVKVNEMRRQGYANVEVTKSPDRDEILITTIGQPAPGLNKAGTLCRKFVATLFSDPPEPDPQPAGADDEHEDQADFSRKVLDHLCGEGELDYVTVLRRAEEMATVFRRAYVCFYVDPKGARVPVQIEAHPEAQNAQSPFENTVQQPVMDPMSGMPAVDPMTGQPMTQPQQVPLDPGESVLRYVASDGRLTDQIAESAWTWAPKLRRDLMNGRHVRLIPATACDLWDADGVLIGNWTPLRDLRRQFPDKFTEEAGEGATKDWQDAPPKARALLPGTTRKEKEAAAQLTGDDRLCFTLRAFYRQSARYPEGFYAVVVGKDLVHRGAWSAEMASGEKETLDLPLTELRQWQDECVMDIVGPGNELRAQQLGAILDHTDQVLNAKIFLPYGSMLNEQDVLDDTKKILTYNPAGKPEQEQIAGLDPSIAASLQYLDAEMQSDVGLGATADSLQGANSGTSGRAKYAIIGQSHVDLTEPRQNLERAYTRGCRLILQLVRAFFTTPQKLNFAGEDGSFQERRWTNADLGSTKDVKLKSGSLSMMDPSMKAQQILELLNAKVPMDAEEVRDALTKNMGVLKVMRENPFRTRIRRQIATWEDGPPDGWQPPPPIPQVMGVDPMGQPMVQQVPQPDPKLAEIWEPVAADELQAVATVRLTELSRAMAGSSYLRWPAPWRIGFDQEYQRMRQFAGVATVPEQQQAAAQQAQAAQQQQMAQAAMKQASPGGERKFAAPNNEARQQQMAQEAQRAGVSDATQS